MTAEHMVTIRVALLLTMMVLHDESVSLEPHKKASNASAVTMARPPREMKKRLLRPRRVHQRRLADRKT
jgi:hypothetical protein